jgi:ubiquitin conjugation factor E4 B
MMPKLNANEPESGPSRSAGNTKQTSSQPKAQPSASASIAERTGKPVVERKTASTPAPSTSPGNHIHIDKKLRYTTDIDRASSVAASPSRPAAPARDDSIEHWADKMLSHIFGVTANIGQEVDSHGHKVIFLPGVSQDLSDDGKPSKLSIDVLAQAIVEAGTNFTSKRPLLDYLLPCWKRAVKTLKLVRNPSTQKEQILREAKQLSFSYCILGVTTPELFGCVLHAEFFPAPCCGS